MPIQAAALASPMLLKLAREARERLRGAPSDLEWGQDDAAVVIVFSAAAIEALLAEFALLRDGARATTDARPQVGLIADTLNELEKQRLSVRAKLLLFKALLPGEPFDTGK